MQVKLSAANQRWRLQAEKFQVNSHGKFLLPSSSLLLFMYSKLHSRRYWHVLNVNLYNTCLGLHGVRRRLCNSSPSAIRFAQPGATRTRSGEGSKASIATGEMCGVKTAYMFMRTHHTFAHAYTFRLLQRLHVKVLSRPHQQHPQRCLRHMHASSDLN